MPVFCFSVIEHVEDPVGLLTGLRGLLRTGGIALLSTPNPDDILMRLGCELRFVYRFGHANFTKWLLHGRPGGETESPLGSVFDQTWRATPEDRGLADYPYGYLRA